MRSGIASIMARAPIPTVPGTPYGGGYYVGRMIGGDGVKYAVILAPKSSGEWPYALNYRNSAVSTPAAGSAWDGVANTAALIALGAGVSAIADFVLQVNNNGGINGYTDWFIPARYQLEMCYRNLKPFTSANSTDSPGATNNTYADPNTPAYTASVPAQTTVTAFQGGGAEAFFNDNYWSSTEYPTANAWCQDMNSGRMPNNSKTLGFRCRLIRLIKI